MDALELKGGLYLATCFASFIITFSRSLGSYFGEGNGAPLQYFAWKIPWTEEPGRLHGVAKSQTRLHFHFHFSLSRIGEGNGNPLQCSCLENPRDEGAWWAEVCEVAQNQSRLSDLPAAAAAAGSYFAFTDLQLFYLLDIKTISLKFFFLHNSVYKQLSAFFDTLPMFHLS